MSFCHIYFNQDVCNGCNQCVEVCMCDVFVPNPAKRKPPTVKYPEECWLCGCCVSVCPKRLEGAIRIITPFPFRGSLQGKGRDLEEQMVNWKLTEHGTAAATPYKPA